MKKRRKLNEFRRLEIVSLIFVSLIVIIFVLTALTQKPQNSCTLEAKVCPDGTVVVRYGANCDFAPCPNTETNRNYCTSEQRRADACIEIYQPVCGYFVENIKCIKAPCAATYSNSCFACMDSNVDYWVDGVCE